MVHLPQQGVLLDKTMNFKFHVTFGPFHCNKLKKKILEWIQSYEVTHFRSQSGPFAENNVFFGNTINIIFMDLLVPFIMQHFKKILRVDPEL